MTPRYELRTAEHTLPHAAHGYTVVFVFDLEANTPVGLKTWKLSNPIQMDMALDYLNDLNGVGSLEPIG